MSDKKKFPDNAADGRETSDFSPGDTQDGCNLANGVLLEITLSRIPGFIEVRCFMPRSGISSSRLQSKDVH